MLFRGALKTRKRAWRLDGVQILLFCCVFRSPAVGAILGPSWGHLWAILGPSWGHLGAILGALGAILEPLGAILAFPPPRRLALA